MTEPMPKGLVRVDPAAVGLTRRRRGRGWSYLDETGAPITDAEMVARIKALVIPPAWQDVWISPDAQGHIQAIGTDAAGRRQYRYHDDWRTARDREKHDRVLTLGERLVKVRTEVVERLGAAGLGRDRVLAGGVRMLDLGVFRAGGEEYAPGDDDDDGTFGLATLRREHVTLKRGAVLFSYPAKGGVPRAVSLKDPLLHKMVELPVAPPGRRRGPAGLPQRPPRLARRAGRGPQRRGEGARGRGVHVQGPAHVERDGARRGHARGGHGR